MERRFQFKKSTENSKLLLSCNVSGMVRLWGKMQQWNCAVPVNSVSKGNYIDGELLSRKSINQSIIQSIIYLPEKFVTIKASKTKHMRTGQQGKTLTVAL